MHIGDEKTMEVIAEYKLKIFSDGSISMERINAESTGRSVVNYGLSNRISQILNIITEVTNDLSATSIDNKISMAIEKTSKKFGISKTSCIDKCSRQLDINMGKFRKMVEISIKDGSKELEELLISKVGVHTKKADEQAIKETFISISEKDNLLG